MLVAEAVSKADTRKGLMRNPALALGAAALACLAGGCGASQTASMAPPRAPAAAQLVQEGPKLTGGGGQLAIGNNNGEEFGESVAVSADGTTALVGSPGINGGFGPETGGVYVFRYTGGRWTQEGQILAPTNERSSNAEKHLVWFGQSVALSANGETALIGGPSYPGEVGEGAAWVFTHVGGTWTQQGPPLIPNDESHLVMGLNGDVAFGDSVALSADGDTALIGGPDDSGSGTTAGDVGAAWVFKRTSESWSQQGSKITPSDESGEGAFGASVALSANGGIAMIGGPRDDGGLGAVWTFTEYGGTWTQDGSKITPHDESGDGEFGCSVSLSATGSTAVVGSPGDDNGLGAVWALQRSGAGWVQSGSKRSGTKLPSARQRNHTFGSSVALSGDGSTALVGSSGLGEAWLLTRSGSSWNPHGTRLARSEGGGATEVDGFGWSVALSENATTAIVGGPSQTTGAAWVFGASGSSGGHPRTRSTAASVGSSRAQGVSSAQTAVLKVGKRLCYLSTAEASAIVGTALQPGEPSIPRKLEGNTRQLGIASCMYDSAAHSRRVGYHEQVPNYALGVALLSPSEFSSGCEPKNFPGRPYQTVPGGCVVVDDESNEAAGLTIRVHGTALSVGVERNGGSLPEGTGARLEQAGVRIAKVVAGSG